MNNFHSSEERYKKSSFNIISMIFKAFRRQAFHPVVERKVFFLMWFGKLPEKFHHQAAIE